ncbi:hypothetical protein [Nocardiopsis valliformis]|uniref:hypothetical protein n=1 Tax=Nocardiopsis valliformis TaxID=239974 RepID=UPI000A01E9B6|nr:hypothetical protein [Nocardiopsis valliformis]
MSPKVGLTRLTGGAGPVCDDDDCPNVYLADNGSIVVQGDTYTGFTPPQGESLVEIPPHVLKEAFRALGW